MLEVAGQLVSIPAVLLLGVVVGLLAGLFGIGGGFLLTPLLAVLFGIPLPIAVGTGMCQMVGTATAGYLKHRELKQSEPRFGLVMVGGSLVGVDAGARTVRHLQGLGDMVLAGKSIPVVTVALSGGFLLFLAVAAFIMLRNPRGGETLQYIRRGPLSRVRVPPYVDLPAVPMSQVSTVVIAYTGLLLGFCSGLLGVGGGIILLPIMLQGFGFPIRQAAGTGTVVMLLTAVTGTIAHARAGNVHLGLAALLMVGAGVAAQVGALATRRLPATLLRRGLGAIILLTMVAIVVDLARRFG